MLWLIQDPHEEDYVMSLHFPFLKQLNEKYYFERVLGENVPGQQEKRDLAHTNDKLSEQVHNQVVLSNENASFLLGAVHQVVSLVRPVTPPVRIILLSAIVLSLQSLALDHEVPRTHRVHLLSRLLSLLVGGNLPEDLVLGFVSRGNLMV